MASTQTATRTSTVRGTIDSPQVRETLRRQVIAKYNEITEKHSADVLPNARGFKEGSQADRMFVRWYEKFRNGMVRTGERTGERMAQHARWHLKTALREQEKEQKVPA